MNALIWLGAAAPATFWAAVAMFVTHSENMLGIMFITLFAASLGMGLKAALEDYQMFTGRG